MTNASLQIEGAKVTKKRVSNPNKFRIFAASFKQDEIDTYLTFYTLRIVAVGRVLVLFPS
jgi:hypothetical protein